ncbi:beta-alanine-activating enzyme [Belonocnema kinseyi]|uniref:beta-alanine-activating enzyme n=1 Tax=Belonocnema kinseyi TaxID=2817044 RepID=UPI00143D135C|nr:beta-alanine-activating enzyme [Belonocnema kinseyi]
MDLIAKKIKYSENAETQNFISLSSICENAELEKFAIEYHDGLNIKKITYQELETTKIDIKEILEGIFASQFVAIDLETPGFCIPSIILGIISSGRGFITLPSTSLDLFSRLKVSHLFSRSEIPDAELHYRLNIHGQSVQLLKLKTNQKKNNSDFQKNIFAYAISTSGTTGVPKIVKVPHESIVPNIFDLKKILAITNRDVIAQLTSMTFDPSIVEIFLGFSSGATLFMASGELKKNPRKLLEIMKLSKVSVFQTTPSILLGKFSEEDLKNGILGEKGSLRILILGGEIFPKMEALKRVRNEKNQTRIFNIYGITEVSCWASVEEFKEENELDISNGFLGKALSETIFEVRSEEGKVLEEGEGILFIGSRKRICSIDEEEINSSRDPVFRNTGDEVMIDNTRRIFYKGRHNKIIKRFGNRIDLCKLENTILKMDSIRNCLAIWNDKNHKLHLCVSKLTNIEKSGEENIKIYLMNNLRNLPDYYRPDEIHLIDHFPLTSNGKVCSRSLEKIIENSSKSTSLKNVENEFQSLWKLTVGSLETGFLKSGGTSIAALQIVNSLSEKFNQEFPDLIGMLLKDSDFPQCLAYLKNQFKRQINSGSEINIKFESKNESSASSSRKKISLSVEESKKLNNSDEIIDRCLWQKCRGFKIGGDQIENEGKCSLKRGIKFQFLKCYDLKKCVDASPTVFEYSSGKIFATAGSHSGLICTIELSSSENYLVRLPDRIEASVLVFDNFRGVVGCYDGFVYCLNLKTGEIYWKFKTEDAVKCTAAMCSEKKLIFVGSYDKHMYCLSLETGSELWRRKASEGSISATARMHFETRTLLFGTLDGTCISLDQVSGKIKWRNSLLDPIFSAPAIFKSGTVVFANVSGKLTCFNILSGHKLWTYAIDGNIFSHLVLVNNSEPNDESIIFASRNKTLYYLGCHSKPTLRYSTRTESPIIATPWHSNEIILNACIDGTLQIIGSSTGDILASHKLDGDVFSSAVLHQDFVVVGSRDNRLYVFKLN